MDDADVTGRRIGAALLDAVLLAFLFVLVAALTGNVETGDGAGPAGLRGGQALVFVLIVLVYYFAGEAASGQTPGKRVLGLRVVDADTGDRVPAGRIAVRTLLRIVDQLPAFYLLGLASVLLTGKRRARIGDLAARTRVVRG